MVLVYKDDNIGHYCKNIIFVTVHKAKLTVYNNRAADPTQPRVDQKHGRVTH